MKTKEDQKASSQYTERATRRGDLGFRISVSARASPGRIWRLLFVPALGDLARSLVPVAFCFFPLSGKRVDSASDMLSARILGGFGNCSADRQKPGRWRRDVSDYGFLESFQNFRHIEITSKH